MTVAKGKQTVAGVIEALLRSEKRPMSLDEISEAIIRRRLYEFHAAEPKQIIRQQLRRATVGLELRAAPQQKRFEVMTDGRYTLHGAR